MILRMFPLTSAVYAVADTVAPKDGWDKFEIVGTTAAGVLVALVGGLFTLLYNRQQRRIEDRRRDEDAAAARIREEDRAAEARARQEDEQRAAEDKAVRGREAEQRRAELAHSELVIRRVRAIQSLLPDFKSGVEKDRRAALLAVRALGDEDFAADLARIYGGPAGISALASLSFEKGVGAVHQERPSVLLAGLTKRLRHSVAIIKSPLSMGSGFSVRPGFVLTAAVVVRDAERGDLRVGAGVQPHPWEVVDYSEDRSLVLLKCDAHMVPLRLATEEPGVEEDVLVVGWNPGTDSWVAEPGIVLGPPQLTMIDGAEGMLLPAELGGVRGFAGAPVVNSALEVVAMDYAKIRDTDDQLGRGLAFMQALPTMKSFLRNQVALGGSE